jgi:AraC-like DNA-binding protein
VSFVDRVIFSSPLLKVGIFRCSRNDRRFADSGPAENHLVVFPRTSVWICHEGSRPFVADPHVATIYNRGQPYRRAHLSQDGDRSDWFGISPAIAMAMAREVGGSMREDPDRPFQAEFRPVSPRLYAAQREVFGLVQHGADSLEIEERALAVVAAAIRPPERPASGHPVGRRGTSARRDLAMQARAAIARRLFESPDLSTLAAELEVSPWHLCRLFREETGTTIHGYRRDLRLRVALERLEGAAGQVSRLAHECGFSSHSHFTAAFRKQFGFTAGGG